MGDVLGIENILYIFYTAVQKWKLFEIRFIIKIMRIKITEKFLWNLYKLAKKKDDIMSDLWSSKWHGFKDPLEMLFPDIWGMRDYLWEQYKKQNKNRATKKRFSRMISYFKTRGYLNVKDLKNRKAVIITPKGTEKVLATELKFGDKEKRKDEKWQMIFFDIPEKRRKDRDRLRKYLGYLGYKKLQQSIWVCPYDVLRETQQIIKNYKLDRFIRLLLVEEVKI